MSVQSVKIDTLAGIFGVSQRQARNLLAEAGARPVARGEWPLGASLRAVFNHLREARTSTEVSRARTRQIEAIARKTELATRRAERELIPVQDAQLALDLVVGRMVEELSGAPARITRDRALRRQIETELNAVRTRVAQSLGTSATFLAEGGALSEFTGADD